MNKFTKRRLLEQRRRRLVLVRGSPALHGGAASTVFSAEPSFDRSEGSNVSAKELEQFFDDAWRLIESRESRDD